MNTYSVELEITINSFIPTNGVIGSGASITATVSPPRDISPAPVPGMFTGDGQNLTVNLANAQPGQVQLNLKLNNANYVLIGVAFTPSTVGGVGRTEFPVIANNRTSTSSLLTITDTCDPTDNNVNFNYGIVVQQVATGQIGIIDPRVRTEN